MSCGQDRPAVALDDSRPTTAGLVTNAVAILARRRAPASDPPLFDLYQGMLTAIRGTTIGTNASCRRFRARCPFSDGVENMDWNRVEGNWKQVKGKGKEKWGQLTDDDLDTVNGRREQLEGKIQQRYGLARDQVRKDVDDWYASQRW